MNCSAMATPGVRRHELQGGRLGGGGVDDDRVVHRAVLLQHTRDLRHLGLLLADGDVDAEQVLPLLVDDRVDGDGRLAGLAVADDQLALAAADRDLRVDGENAGLHGRVHAGPRDDVRRDLLDGPALAGGNRPLAVDGLAQGVDHAADHRVADGHLGHAAGRADLVALFDGAVVAQDHGPHDVLFEVQRHADDRLAGVVAAGELQQFPGQGAGQPEDAGDAVAGLHDRARVGRDGAGIEALDLLPDDGGDLFWSNRHAVLLAFLRDRLSRGTGCRIQPASRCCRRYCGASHAGACARCRR